MQKSEAPIVMTEASTRAALIAMGRLLPKGGVRTKYRGSAEWPCEPRPGLAHPRNEAYSLTPPGAGELISGTVPITGTVP